MPHLHDPGLLDRLLAAGRDVNARDVDGLTPLFAAVHGMGDVELIRALIAAGAAIDVADEDGVSAGAWVEQVRKADLDVLGPLFGIDR